MDTLLSSMKTIASTSAQALTAKLLAVDPQLAEDLQNVLAAQQACLFIAQGSPRAIDTQRVGLAVKLAAALKPEA